MRIHRVLVGVFLLLWVVPVWAQGVWPKEERVPGGIAILSIPQRGDAPPWVSFQGQRVFVAQRQGQWFAWVGLPLDLSPGAYAAQWQTREGEVPLPFDVAPKDYPAQHLDVDFRYVSLSAEDQARVQRELPELRGAMDAFRPVHRPLPALVQPVEGRFSSPFGFRRVFNGQPRNPHTGLDIAAPQGTPILAALPGRVTALNDYFFNGKTLVIDHGMGLTSLYCHLSEFAELAVGSEVSAGQLIGRVGSTGRSTGPHLHWTMSLNGARVNPELFLP